MAITPVLIPAIPSEHANLAYTDFARVSDKNFRIDGAPTEMYSFKGDGATTTKVLTTGMDRVVAALIFNMTTPALWSAVTLAALDAADPTVVNISGIPASTDVFLLIVIGEKAVPIDSEIA